MKGTSMQAGDQGILRNLSFDQIGEIIQMEIEREQGHISLAFALRALEGPRNGHMREFFELGEDVSTPRPTLTPTKRAEPPGKNAPMENEIVIKDPGVDGPDRLLEIEDALRRKYDHIGVATSIAEVYAERMRAFRRIGEEARAIAAFKLAKDWMFTYASWATSGGEGTANSRERDLFCAALVAEFGYDPTASETKI